MKILLNGCHYSKISVTPTNWNTKKASLKKPWKIHYRFYDPAFKDDPKYKGGLKQVAIRGINTFHTLDERQAITDQVKFLGDLCGSIPDQGLIVAEIQGNTIFFKM